MFESTTIVPLVLFTASSAAYAHPGHAASAFHIHGLEFATTFEFVLGLIIVAAALYLSVNGFRKNREEAIHPASINP